jgi:hypothetical protein
MIRVMIKRGTQTNAAKFPTVGRPAEEVITLGGYPPPVSSQPPRPSPLCVTARSLMEVFGQIGQPTDVLHHFSNPLVLLVPGGAEFDIEISN